MASKCQKSKPSDLVPSWRLGLNTMHQRWAAVLTKEIPDILHDVTFLVGGDREPIRCHKLVLTVASPVFQAIFRDATEIENNNACIEVPDLDFNGFKTLIMYAYTGRVDIKIKDALATMHAANKYDIPEIAKHCSDLFRSKLSVENAVTIYQSALALNDVSLQEKAHKFLIENFNEILDGKDFLELSSDTMIKLITMDEVTVTSEAKLFLDIVRWAKNQCVKLKQEPSNQNIVNILKDIVKHIRFPLMSAMQFTTHVEPTGILSEKECYKLFKYFSLPEQVRSSASLKYNIKQRAKQIQSLTETEILFWPNNTKNNYSYTMERAQPVPVNSAFVTFQFTNFKGTNSVFLNGITLTRGAHSANEITNNFQIHITIMDDCIPANCIARREIGFPKCMDMKSVTAETFGKLESQANYLWKVAFGRIQLYSDHIYKITFRCDTDLSFATKNGSDYALMTPKAFAIPDGSKSVTVGHVGGHKVVTAMNISL